MTTVSVATLYIMDEAPELFRCVRCAPRGKVRDGNEVGALRALMWTLGNLLRRDDLTRVALAYGRMARPRKNDGSPDALPRGQNALVLDGTEKFELVAAERFTHWSFGSAHAIWARFRVLVRASKLLTSGLLLSTLVVGAPARAATLAETDEFKLSLSGWARAGFELTLPDEGPTEYAPRLTVARLKTTAAYEGVGSYVLQINAHSGTVELVTMALAFNICHALTFSVGRLKTPSSYEYLIQGARTEFAARTLASSVLPRRLTGAMVTWEGVTPLRLDVGAFVPGGERNLELRGPVIVARAQVTPVDAFEMHVSFTQQIERPDASLLPQVNYGQAVDVGARVEAGGWHAHAELVVHLNDEGDVGTPLITSFVTGYRFDHTRGPAVRPVLGFDLFTDDDVTRTRGRLGTDLFWADDKVRVGVNYTADSRTVDPDGSALEHSVFAFGQVSF
jgi:hypothetical protein